MIGFLCLLISFVSASQDIVLDAYRREILPDNELGLGNSYFVNAYRLSSLIPGSLALILSDLMSWNLVFLIVASSMSIGIIGTLLMDEPQLNATKPKTSLLDSLSTIFQDFSRLWCTSNILYFIFILLYKLGDNMATALSTLFGHGIFQDNNRNYR